MVVINVSLLLIVAVLMFSQGWITGFHNWVQSKVSEP